MNGQVYVKEITLEISSYVLISPATWEHPPLYLHHLSLSLH